MRKVYLRGKNYRAVVRHGVGEYTRTISPAFSMNEIAKHLRLPVTQHLRRRINELVDESYLIRQRVYSGNKGMQIVYWKPPF